MDINEEKRLSVDFLQELYKEAKGFKNYRVDSDIIEKKLEIDIEKAARIKQGLVSDDLIIQECAGRVSITDNGIKKAKEASSGQDDSSNLLSVNIFNNKGSIVNSNIAQAGQNATQSICIDNQIKETLLTLIEEIRSYIELNQIGTQNKNDIQADITTIKSQLNSSKSKKSIISESFTSIRNILQGCASSLITPHLINKLNDAISLIQNL